MAEAPHLDTDEPKVRPPFIQISLQNSRHRTSEIQVEVALYLDTVFGHGIWTLRVRWQWQWHCIWTRTSPTNHPFAQFLVQKPRVTGPARSRWQWHCIWTRTSPTNHPCDQFLVQKPRVTGPARSRWQWHCIWTWYLDTDEPNKPPF